METIENKRIVNDYTHQAIVNLFAREEIEVFEVFENFGLSPNQKANNQEVCRKIQHAILDEDHEVTGKIIFDMFICDNKEAIDNEVENIIAQEKQSEDEEHGIYPINPTEQAMDDAGVSDKDFLLNEKGVYNV
jgi:hypothetical protein